MKIVFTAILGNRCDSLKPAPVGADRCVCFVTDPAAFPDAKGWELIAHPAENPRREAWRLRAVPHTLFADYDRVVWIDASFTLTNLHKLLKHAGGAPVSAIRHHRRDNAYEEGNELARIGQSDPQQIRRQLLAYHAMGFRPSHLSISCIIVRDHSDKALWFNQTWAREIEKYPGDNTQVSLDYAAWVNGFNIRALHGSRHETPYAIHDHTDHKKRRKPYDKPRFGSFGSGAQQVLHGSESVLPLDKAKEFLS